MKKILALLLSLASMQTTLAPMSRDNVASNPIHDSHLNNPDDHKEVCCTYSEERVYYLWKGVRKKGTYSGMCCGMPSSTNYDCDTFLGIFRCGCGSCFCNSNAIELWFVCCWCCIIPCPALCRDHNEDIIQLDRLVSDRKLNKQRRMKYIVTCIDRMQDINQDYLYSGSEHKYYWPPPLHNCIDKHDEEVAQLLIKKGADVNKKAFPAHSLYAEYTPLHVAISSKAEGCIKLLIFAGADPDIECRDNKTPRWLAQAMGISSVNDAVDQKRLAIIQKALIVFMPKELHWVIDSYLTGKEKKESKETKSIN